MKKYISYLNIISAVAVVYLHVNGCFWTYSTESYWFSANIIECLFFFAVPVFFMITGATLIDYSKKYSTNVFLKKRFKKTVIPYIAVSIAAIVYRIIAKKETFSFFYIIKCLLEGSCNPHFWFFIPLFGVYLSIPLLTYISSEKKIPLFKWYIIGYFILCSLFPFALNVLAGKSVSTVTIPAVTGYIFYVMLGYYLDRKEWNGKERIFIYSMGFAGLLMHMIGTYCLSGMAGDIVKTYKGYLNVPCIMYSAAIFVFVKYGTDKIAGLKPFQQLLRLQKYTFELFLLQYFVIDAIERFTLLNVYSLTYRLICPLFVITVIVLFTRLIRRFIPLGKVILP